MPELSFRFVHAADLHLDTAFAALGRAAPEIADRLRDASLEAFDALVRLAIEREAAFVVFAGDIYDSADRGVRAQLRFLRGVERLGERGIQAFVAHGNHDPLDGWSAMRHTPANLTVFGADGVETHAVLRGGEPLAQIYGISYARRDVTENLALRFRRTDAPGLHVGVLHCNVGWQPGDPTYGQCSVDDLKAAGMDYWALGHIHDHQCLAAGRPWVVYPGCLQGSKANEVGPKGAVLVEVAGGVVDRVDFVELGRVRFARAEIDISNQPDLPALRKAILGSVPIGVDTVLTVTLVGRGALHRDLRRPGAVPDLLRDVRDELGTTSPFVWIDRITDATRPKLDRDVIRERGDFSADLVRLVDDLRGDRRAFEELMASFALPARIDSSDSQDTESLLREAEDRALDLLESELRR